MLRGELQEVDWPMFKGVPTQQTEVNTINIHTVCVELPAGAHHQPEMMDGAGRASKSTSAVALETKNVAGNAAARKLLAAVTGRFSLACFSRAAFALHTVHILRALVQGNKYSHGLRMSRMTHRP